MQCLKSGKQSNARDSTVCDDLQTHNVQLSPRMGLCSHFGCLVKKKEKKKRKKETRVVIRKRMKDVWIYIHAPKQKAQAGKTQKISE